jgi:signal peptidase I
MGGTALAGRTQRRWTASRLLAAIVGLVALVSGLAVWTSGQASASKSTTTFVVNAGNMEPTLQIGAQVVVNRLAYRHHNVKRGDIIVFSNPPTLNCGGPFVADHIDRVIGLPGDTISLTNGSKGYIVINGKRLDETWLPTSERGITFPGPVGTPYSLAKAYKVPAGRYFVMGDNRTDSCDSRYWGPVAKVLIVGRVER